MVCSSCGVESQPGSRFCHQCGRALARVCPNCGSAAVPEAKFCSECGTPLTGSPSRESAASAVPAPAPYSTLTELRHVSVLFCDLVGFTPFSESRDAEEVRELLSGYFDVARAIVARYGGVVEKFIGDAVMALWGAPVAQEDDAERAVRAGLELVSAVKSYGAERQVELEARVGIVTGGAATTETAEEGLVIGDRVNTAARIQAVAPPSCCYVDEPTRSATAAAIAYLDAGEHVLKGKVAPVRLYQAMRVVAAVAGSQRPGVLEAPFVGRDHEVRLVKELFHASAERKSARLVLVSGVAGVGKSRLGWEFFKYSDGLAGEVLWHAGRCLSYGEGVSYWALSEMVRARLSISEEDPLDVVAERLVSGLERWITDPSDREFIYPRLGQLLGLPSPKVLSREELFAGWRLFFECLADHLPVVIVVEDLQWADSGMVEFLDHLLDWSSEHAIFILVLSRPEGSDRRSLALSRRSVTTLPLDPLPGPVIGALLDGLVTDLPTSTRERIVERSEGIPLYAVETVRALLDKGVLEKSDAGTLHLVGEVGELEIPPGLTALIAARLDSLAPEERRLVKECSVLGTSFPRQAIEAISETDPAGLDDLLRSLVRKEVLAVRAEKLSPERGQYAFTQSLIRSVAYDLLTRTERKSRHLKTADHLRAAFPDGGAEMAEVIGAHLYDAYRAAGDDPDAAELRARACHAYMLAGERAAAVGAPEAAEAAYLQAVELTTDEAEQAAFFDRAGRAATTTGWYERAIAHFRTAIAAHQSAGRTIDAAAVTARLGNALGRLGRNEEAITATQEALASLEGAGAPPDVTAEVQASLAGALIFRGRDLEAASGPVGAALALAEHHELGEQFAQALNLKGILLKSSGLPGQAGAYFELCIAVARRHGVTRSEMLAEANLADLEMTRDLPDAEEHARAGLAVARRRGLKGDEVWGVSNLMSILTTTGRFDEAILLGTEFLQADGNDRPGTTDTHFRLLCVQAFRGNADAARAHLLICRRWADSDDVQEQAFWAVAEAAVLLAEGESRQALAMAQRAMNHAVTAGLDIAHEAVRLGFPIAIDAAIDAGDLEEAGRLTGWLGGLPRGEVPPFLRAQVMRGEGLLAIAMADEEASEERLVMAEEAFGRLGYLYWVARTQLDRAKWLTGMARPDEAAALASTADEALAGMGVAATMLAEAEGAAEPVLVNAVDGLGTPSSR